MLPQPNKPSGGSVRLSDIAARLNVSTMTVSLAMRSHPSISKERIIQVQQAAKEMGYRPNAMAAALAHRKWAKEPRSMAATLAWLNHWDNPRELRNQEIFDRYWHGALAGSEELGYQLEEFVWKDGMSGERLQKILLARNIPGIIAPPHPRPPDWEGWSFDKFSVVRIGHSISNLPVDLISTDQVRCSMEGFARIRERGYQRVGLVTSQWAERNTLFRAGFLLACNQADGQDALPMLGLLDQGEASLPDDMEHLDKWMRVAKPDAILTDVRSMPRILAALGHRVPETVGVAMLGETSENMAGIFQNAEEVGRMAAEMLITLIQRGVRGIPAMHRVHLAAPLWVDGFSLPPRI